MTLSMSKFILTAMLMAAAAIHGAASATDATALRKDVPLDGKWMFSKTPAEGQQRQWEYVDIPHSWNADDGTTPDYYRGGARYEYDLYLDSVPTAKRGFLRFEAVSQEADVAVNGVPAGNHKGAFNAFCFEVTELLHAGNNRITVDATNAHNDNIAPLEGDFTIFGGIYRPAKLMWLPTTCITPLDYASSGTYITQREVTDDMAKLHIVTKLDGKALTHKNNLSLRTSIIGPDGNVVATRATKCGKNPDGKVEVTGDFEIKHPALWSKETPENRYTVRHELMDGKAIADTLSQRIGLRYFSIDPEKGFFFNGKPYRLAGVNRHQDRPGKGWAISQADHEEDMALIREIGANTIRLAHYPHAEQFYNLCDDNGMLVWAEIPFVGHGTDSPEFTENLKTQLTELIRQNYNHPSIFTWSLFNEIGFGDNPVVKPAGIVAELNDLAHAEDPTRPTIAATNRDDLPENWIPDYLAYNNYPGWYWAEPSAMGPSIDQKNKGRGVAVSEYGAGGSIDVHDQHVTVAPRPDGHYHPEEWQATVHEGTYSELAKRPYVWATWVWNMFDFASSWRNEGNARGINDKGLVTYDRKTPKDAFYFYKAQWSDTPMVHITSQRHTIRDKASTPVKVYSNCDTVELSINGRTLSAVKPENGIATWDNVALQPGKNRISATGKSGSRTITDSCEWDLK